ncbi:MAG: hypothetical protein LBT47_08795 [Deltaproteobacteria bacterium]|nr:hypothetical protein [Deltaproteobacteria bacterium]
MKPDLSAELGEHRIKLSHWLRVDNQFLSGIRLAMVNSFGYLSLFSLLWQNMERFTTSIDDDWWGRAGKVG